MHTTYMFSCGRIVTTKRHTGHIKKYIYHPLFPIHNKFYIYLKVEEYEKRVVVQKLSHKHALCTQFFFFLSFISQRLYEVDFLCVPRIKKTQKYIL